MKKIIILSILIIMVCCGCSSENGEHECYKKATIECGSNNTDGKIYYGSGVGCSYKCKDYSKFEKVKNNCTDNCHSIFRGPNEVSERLECIKEMCTN